MSQQRFCFGCTPVHSQSAEIQPFYGRHRFATPPPICHFRSECFRSIGFLPSWVFCISRACIFAFLLNLATEFQQFSCFRQLKSPSFPQYFSTNAMFHHLFVAGPLLHCTMNKLDFRHQLRHRDMDWDDPVVIEKREALKQAYLQLQPHHPSLPPTLKDFQVFCGKIT